MLEEFRKLREEKEKKFDNLILPDDADTEQLAEDNKPMTRQIQEVYETREELGATNPRMNDIIVRKPSKPVDASKSVNTDLLDIPKFCDQCYLIDKCPHYQPKSTCYFRNSVKIQDRNSLLELMKMILEIQGERVLFGRLIEQSEGGYIDQNLSREIKMLMELMKDFKEILAEPRDEVSIKVSTKAGSTPGGAGGILSQIFGVGTNNGEDKKEV